MGAPSTLNIRFILSFTEKIQSLQDHNSKHKEMNTINRQSLFVKNVNPNNSKREINQRENEVNPRKDGFPSRKIITASVFAFKIVHSGLNIHRNLDLLKTISKNESVLISISLGIKNTESVLFLEGIEGVNGFDKVRLKSARDITFFQLLDHMKP
uniref:Uncharacterized protein n=1 Tax=Cucumis sativus TaxID=3659 RepID=A0A0A0L126_CUCSA